MASNKPQRILMVLYEGGEAARKQPKILGAVENALGLREWLQSLGHHVTVTSDTQGVAEKMLPDVDIVISQPFWPMYMDARRLEIAKNLKLIVTAGVGSDHTDLTVAAKKGITVAEVTGSNVVSVAEHAVMMILAQVRNYLPAHEISKNGGWDIATCASRAYDLENKHVGSLGLGRIGYRIMQRLKPFDCHLHYYDKFRIPEDKEKELGLVYHPSPESLFKSCQIVTINVPLHPETQEMVDKRLLDLMQPGSYLINTARGLIVKRDDLVEAVKSGHIAGYAGDVWYPQPAPADHPWRTMPYNGMVPHYSGTTLDAQARYAAGTKEILENYFTGRPQRPEYLILDQGRLASSSYTVTEKRP